ncbi:PilZ domain-containing protein [Thermodesulfobacteriota bacterium]
MTASESPYGIVPRIFELINDLTEEEQLNLLKQLLKDNINTHLFKLVVCIPEDEQKNLVKQLEEMIQKRGSRKYTRKTCLINVDYAVGGRVFSNYIQDISTTGVFIETSESFPVGQEVLMTFSFPDREDSLKIDGEISRITPQGIGVRFNYKSQIQKDVLEDLVEKMKEH